MSKRLDALRREFKGQRLSFTDEAACVEWLCSKSFPQADLCDSIIAWSEMLTYYAHRRATEKNCSVVSAFFFILYRFNRIVPYPRDELAGAQLAATMWHNGLRSPTAYDQETLLDYFYEELCGRYEEGDEGEPPTAEALEEMAQHVCYRLRELGQIRLMPTSHKQRIPRDYSESLWGAADGVMAVWRKVTIVADEYAAHMDGARMPDEYVQYVVASTFVDYVWIFMAGDQRDIDPVSLWDLVSRFPHDSKWISFFARLIDEDLFDSDTVYALLACDTLPPDKLMNEAAECVVFWHREEVPEPLNDYLSSYLAAQVAS